MELKTRADRFICAINIAKKTWYQYKKRIAVKMSKRKLSKKGNVEKLRSRYISNLVSFSPSPSLLTHPQPYPYIIPKKHLIKHSSLLFI